MSVTVKTQIGPDIRRMPALRRPEEAAMGRLEEMHWGVWSEKSADSVEGQVRMALDRLVRGRAAPIRQLAAISAVP